MSLSAKNYKGLLKLAALKNAIIANHGNQGEQFSLLYKAQEILESIKYPDVEAQRDIDECLKVVNQLLQLTKDIRESDNHFDTLMNGVLETYFVYLDTHGSESERVLWLEHCINSFVQSFSNFEKKDLTDDRLKHLVTLASDDILITYEESFTSEMRESVSNYQDFKVLINRLGLYDKVDSVNSPIKSANIFSK